MNPQQNNEGSNRNFGESGSSQVMLLSTEFKLRLNSKLDEKIMALEKEKEQMIAAERARMDGMKAKSAKLKKMKKEIKSAKIDVQNLRQTRDSQRQVLKGTENYVCLLRKELEKHQEETKVMAKQQGESIEHVENKWKEHQAKYETLPLAVIRSNEKTVLQKAKIELMMKKRHLAEINQIITQRQAIEGKRRNNLAIKCAELYREFKVEKDKMQTAVATRKNLEETLLQQEETLAKLTKKEKEQLAALQHESAMNKSKTEIMSLLTPVQKVSLKIPCFNLSTIGQSLIQSMPTFTKDPDTASITSSLIDNLIEPRDSLPRETNEHDGQNQERTTSVVPLDSNKESNNVEEDPDISENTQQRSVPCATLRFTGMDEEEEEFERFGTAPEIHEEVKESSWPKASVEKKIVTEEDEGSMDEKLTNKRDGQTAGREYWRAGCSQAQEFHTPMQNCPSEIKRPRISKTETVQLKLNPNKPRESPMPSRENSISKYMTPSTSAGDWKADYLSNAFSYQESQRGNADLDSVVGSMSSMQSDDFAKRYHFQFSPEREDQDEYMKSIEGNEVEYRTPRPSGAGPPQIGTPLRVQGFFDMESVQETPTSRRKKKDFISLF